MSEELFEKHLRNALSDVERLRLIRILDSREGARAFAEFVQEWTLLAEAARGATAELRAPLRPRSRRRIPVLRGSGGSPWVFAGAAAAAVFAVALALSPRPKPAPAVPPPVAARPALPPPSEPPRDLPPPPSRRARRSVAVRPEAAAPSPEPLPGPSAPAPPPPAPEPAPPPPAPSTAPTVVERPAVAVVEDAEGDVSLARGATLREGEVLVTGAGSRATAVVPGARLELGPATALEGAGSVLFLSRGRLTADVEPRPSGAAFSLRTPHGEVRVLGTRFTVVVDELSRVEVLEGRVKVVRAPDGASTELAAGRTVTLGKPGRWDLGWVELVRDVLDARDTQLSEAEPAGYFGGAPEITVDGDGPDGKSHWALLRWDLSGIPATAVVRSAVLTIYVTDTAPDMGYGIFEAKRPWVEGEATWRQAAAGRPWRASGARSGADRGSELLATLAPRDLGGLSILLNDAGLAVVQRWIRVPGTNHGIFIGHSAMSDGFRFESRESADPARRPRLTVTYTLGGGR